MSLCPVCQRAPANHSHHRLPREYGGENGPTIDICASCHDLVHRQAEAEYKGDYQELFSEEGGMRKRARILIEDIHTARRNHQMGLGPQASQILRPLTIMITEETRQRLHRAKALRGYTNLNTFMNDVIAGLIRNV